MPFRFTKTYDAGQAFSCVFRHHRASDNTEHLRGHRLEFTFVFEADQLDDSKRAVVPEIMSPLYSTLREWFYHTTIVAQDDPLLDELQHLHNRGAMSLVQMDHVGELAFARHVWNLARDFLRITGLEWRVRCVETRCRYEGNTGIYMHTPATTN